MSMSIFDIDNEIRAALAEIYEQVDEDGCFSGDFSKIEELNAERDKKVEGLALFYKETLAEAEAIKAEADKLAKRAKIAKNKAERLKEYLSFVLRSSETEKFTTNRVKITFRPSEQVVIEDVDKIAKKWLKVKTEPDKAGIKAALKEGAKIKGAHLETKQNIQIK